MCRLLLLPCLLVVLVGCARESTSPTIAQAVASRGVLQPGSRITVGSARLTLHSISDPYLPTDPDSRPQDGERFVAIEVTVRNEGDVPYVADGLADWTLIDAGARAYDPNPLVNLSQPLGSKHLNPRGDAVRGWVGFVVPEAAAIKTLQFKPPTSKNEGRFSGR